MVNLDGKRDERIMGGRSAKETSDEVDKRVVSTIESRSSINRIDSEVEVMIRFGVDEVKKTRSSERGTNLVCWW